MEASEIIKQEPGENFSLKLQQEPQKIVNIKQEPEIQFCLELPQYPETAEIVNNIKQEPGVNFTLELQQEPPKVVNIKQEQEAHFSLELPEYQELPKIVKIKQELPEIVNIKQESPEIVNIKQEPEIHFCLELPQYPEPTEIVNNIKQEPGPDFSLKWPGYQEPPEIVNIKQEPEIQFCLELPKYQEPSISGSELRIIVKKFNRGWKKNVKMYSSYFACGKCNYVSKDIRSMNRHSLRFASSRCRGERKKCSFCSQMFSRKDREKHELQEHRNGLKWICNQCPFNTLAKLNLKDHCRKHSKKFSCSTCMKKFALPCLLRDHLMQNRHGVYATREFSKAECDECGKSFSTDKHLKQHKYLIHSNRKYECDICGKTFKIKEIIKKHLNFCGKPFTSRKRISIRQTDRTNDQIPCPICSKQIVVSYMKKHMKRLHASGQHFLACSVYGCKNRFSTVDQLNEHKSIHVGIRRYKCLTCNKEMKSMGSFKYHMKVQPHRASETNKV